MRFRRLLALVAAMGLPLAGQAQDKPKPKRVDYEAELNNQMEKGITPDKNACVLLWKAFGPTPEGGNGMPPEFFKRLGIDEPPKEGKYFVSLGTIVKEKLGLDQNEYEGVWTQQSWASNRPWAAKDYPYIGLWLTENEKPLAIAIEASKRTEYFNPLVSRKNEKGEGSLIGALLPAVQKTRELSSAFCARAMLRVHEGKYDEAWADLMACHRLARLTGRGGTLIEGLVGYAIEAIVTNAELAYLENAKLSSKQVLEKLRDLQNLPPLPGVAEKIDTAERYMFLDSIDLIKRGGTGLLEGLAGGAGNKPTDEELKALASIDWDGAIKKATSFYDRMIAALKLPTRAERLRELTAIDEQLKKLKLESKGNLGELAKLALAKGEPGKMVGEQIGNVLITLLFPAIQKVSDACDRSCQIHMNLQLAFALAAYQKDNGKYPAKVDDLAPKYISAVPRDIFSAKPLNYKPSDKGYLLYSVGVNGKDDEGRWFDDVPPGDDPRIKMPLPPLKKE